jgi:hypothetical protein
MRRFVFCLCSVLLLTACFFGSSGAVGQAVYSLQLQGFAWTHSTLTALVITADNESWWNPAFINTAIRAIGQWNEAITFFAQNHTDYSYLSDLTIQSNISNKTLPGYDIYINWTQSSLNNASDEIGLTRTFVSGDSTITNCTINLAVHANHQTTLTDVDMQNIALHELGHGLGLGHCNYTGDLMYSYYNVGNSAEEISSLDTYGVATVFGWMKNPTSFYPVSGWFTQNSVTLPSYITYQGLPVSPQNTPPLTLANNPVGQYLVLIYELLLHPEIDAIIIGIILLFVIIGFVTRRPRQHRTVTAGS